MKAIFRRVLIGCFFLLLLPSCNLIRPSLMFKTPRKYKFAQFSDSLTKQEYRIVKSDIIRVSLYSNNGFKRVNLTEENRAQNDREFIDIPVELDDSINLPVFGRIKASGRTQRELESEVEKLYNIYYVDSYVTVSVINKRVMVWHGMGGAGKVVPLENNNVTVLEAIALSGGITEDGKSRKIKLIRNPGPNPQVYMFDLSTIDGLRQGNTVVMANDIIYVEPRIRFARRLAQELTPFLTILSTTLILINLLKQ